jgi:Flp pilus assembly protein TadB
VRIVAVVAAFLLWAFGSDLRVHGVAGLVVAAAVLWLPAWLLERRYAARRRREEEQLLPPG